MIKTSVLTFGALLLINNATFISAQRNAACSGEHNFCWPDKKQSKSSGDAWQYNNQSKSGMFAQGETSEVNLIAYKDTEYMINFCTGDEQLEGKIQFKIYDFASKSIRERKIVKTEIDDPYDTTYSGRKILINDTTYTIRYEKTKHLIYDNAKKNNAQSYAFISKNTRKLLVEVFVPESGAPASETGEEINAATYACVGMLVLHQKALTTGLK